MEVSWHANGGWDACVPGLFHLDEHVEQTCAGEGTTVRRIRPTWARRIKGKQSTFICVLELNAIEVRYRVVVRGTMVRRDSCLALSTRIGPRVETYEGQVLEH